MKKQIGILCMLISLCGVSCDDSDNSVPDPVPQNQHEGHEYVDLGLPSGALWATSNVEVDGSIYFAWGETMPKEVYSVATYKYYGSGVDSTLTKYSPLASCGQDGFIDGVFELLPEDDAAHVHWGGEWRTPVWDEWKELYASCTWEKATADDGSTQYVGTSKYNGMQIILHSVGVRQGSNLQDYGGVAAYYWSATLDVSNCLYANGISLTPSTFSNGNISQDGKRAMGHCVRPVIPGDRDLLRYVDLGLPSGVKWANKNLGASDPEDAGILYAWGEMLPKPFYDFTNYAHCQGTPKTLTKYCTSSEFGTVDGKTQLEPADDASRQILGEGWRIPTVDEVTELMEQCTWTFETVGEQKGYTVTGPNGNSIYIPMSGTMWQTSMEFVNMRGFYWSSTLDDAGDQYAEGLFINPQSFSLGNGFTRASGRTIRPVHD